VKLRPSCSALRGPRQGIGDGIVLAGDVLHVCCELGNVGQVALLPGRPRIGDIGHGECKRLVVGKGRKPPALEVVSEVPSGEIKRQQLFVKSAVLLLGNSKLFAEESQGLPDA
jgi:hypothetical protein